MTINEDNISTPFPSLSNLQRLAISESGFVFDPVSGHNFTVNETGLTILRLLQKDTEIAPILAQLSAEYDAPIRDIERDVLEFAGVLRDFVGD
jgi:Coenzyme PQQ synthesis protein D (PqqD)